MRIKGYGTGKNRHQMSRTLVRGSIVAVGGRMAPNGLTGVFITLLDEKHTRSATWPLYPINYEVQLTEVEVQQIISVLGSDAFMRIATDLGYQIK